MSRTHSYRRKPDEEDLRLIDQISDTRLLLVQAPAALSHTLSFCSSRWAAQTPGPTSFVVKAIDCDTKFRISIGDVQKCSCNSGPHLCLHIYFVMLRVLRVPPDNPLVWQWSLTDSEIELVLQMRFTRAKQPKQRSNRQPAAGPAPERRAVDEGDVCPICQEEMLENEPLTYCQDGCRQSIHAKCMQIWVDHQSQQPEVKCPFCRITWSEAALQSLRKQNQASTNKKNVACCSCRVFPIDTAQMRCVNCRDYNLCQACFDKGAHPHHPFVARSGPGHRWKPAPRQKTEQRDRQLPTELAQLQDRELTVNDYDLLLQLDAPPQITLSKYLVGCMGNPTKADVSDGVCAICSTGSTCGFERKAICGCWFHDRCLEASFEANHLRCPMHNKPFFLGLAGAKKKQAPVPEQGAVSEAANNDLLQLCGTCLQLPGVGNTQSRPRSGPLPVHNNEATGVGASNRNNTASARRVAVRGVRRQQSATVAGASLDMSQMHMSIGGGSKPKLSKGPAKRNQPHKLRKGSCKREEDNDDVDVSGLTMCGSNFRNMFLPNIHNSPSGSAQP